MGLRDKLKGMFTGELVYEPRVTYTRVQYAKILREQYPDATSYELKYMLQKAKERGILVDNASEDAPVDYRYKPTSLLADVPTVDVYLNQSKEERTAVPADWYDARIAIGELLEKCTRPITKSIMDNLRQEIIDINTTFSRMFSICADPRHQDTKAMVIAAATSFYENVLRSVGQLEKPPMRRLVDHGRPSPAGLEYESAYNSTYNLIISALGEEDTEGHNKSMYNNRILEMIRVNKNYWMRAEEDAIHPETSIYLQEAARFHYHQLIYEPSAISVYYDGRSKCHRNPETGRAFMVWDDDLKMMVAVPGEPYPSNLSRVMSEPLDEAKDLGIVHKGA